MKNLMIKVITSIFVLFSISIFYSCNSGKLVKIPIEDFVGTWELQGRPMFNGIKIRIEENEQGKLTGKVVELNSNKYVKMFVEKDDTWITVLKRSSNFEFELTEKKIASKLFAIYGQGTTLKYKVQFIDKDQIVLGENNSDPTKSEIKYIRIGKD